MRLGDLFGLGGALDPVGGAGGSGAEPPSPLSSMMGAHLGKMLRARLKGKTPPELARELRPLLIEMSPDEVLLLASTFNLCLMAHAGSIPEPLCEAGFLLDMQLQIAPDTGYPIASLYLRDMPAEG